MSGFISSGWNRTSNVTSMPGEIYPETGLIEKSGRNLAASHLNLAPISPSRKVAEYDRYENWHKQWCRKLGNIARAYLYHWILYFMKHGKMLKWGRLVTESGNHKQMQRNFVHVHAINPHILLMQPNFLKTPNKQGGRLKFPWWNGELNAVAILY